MRQLFALGGALALLLLALAWRATPTQLRVSSSYFPWEPVGPVNLGHNLITGLRVGNVLYVGSAFGGLFRSTDNGRSWEVVLGFNLNQNGEGVYRCPAVTALGTDGTRLYVGTGAIVQYNPSGISPSAVATTAPGLVGAFGRPGMGVFVSSDGGNTFSNQNSTWKLTYPALSYANDYANTGILNVVDIAVNATKVAILTPDSLFLSTDGLVTLQGVGRIAGGRRLRSVAWGANDALFVTTNDSIYRSTDGGQSFVPLSGLQLPPGVTGSSLGGGNAVVRTAPSDPSKVYLATANASGTLVAVWASPDNGDTWTRIANQETPSFAVLGGQGVSTLALEIDPADPTHFLLGGATLWEFSPVQGWQRINPANQDPIILRLPALIRDVVFLPNGEWLVIGDGRLVRVTQGGTRIEDASKGIQAARVLSVAVSPRGDVYASGPSPVLITSRREADPAGLFRLVPLGTFTVSSPFGHVAVSSIDPDISFFSYQAGRLRTSQDRGQNYVSFYTAPASSSFDGTFIQSSSGAVTDDRPDAYGPLYPPFALVEKFGEKVLNRDGTRSGTSYLFIATGRGLWTITNPISTNPDTIPHWNRVSGTTGIGVNANLTYANYLNSSNAIPTALAADSAYTVWIGTSNGQLLRVKNAHDITIDRTLQDGVEDLTAALLAGVGGRYISAVAVHPKNPDLLAVAVGSYAGPADRIFLSTNATASTPTFTAISTGLPDVPVYSLFFYPDSSYLLFAGTEWGLWRCMDVRTPTWEEMTGEVVGRVPVTAITWKPYRYQVDTVGGTPDLPQVEARLLPDPEKPLYIATWGRGIWKLSSRFATSLVGAGALPRGLSVSVYPNPFQSQLFLEVRLPEGARQLTYRLYTLDGRCVAAETYSRALPAGYHTLAWPVPALPAGLYVLRVEGADGAGRQFATSFKLLHP